MDQDREHLRLLAVFHWVVAGIAALFALFPLIHLAFGIALISRRLPLQVPEQKHPEVAELVRDVNEFIGWAFILFSISWIIGCLAFAVCLAVSGRFLSDRRHYRYCFVMAAIACAFMPFGTVLGVFTIIVLTRDSVRELFGVGVGTHGMAAEFRSAKG